jgi:hypothetical protein
VTCVFWWTRMPLKLFPVPSFLAFLVHV